MGSFPYFTLRKLRLRMGKGPSQGHMAGKSGTGLRPKSGPHPHLFIPMVPNFRVHRVTWKACKRKQGPGLVGPG